LVLGVASALQILSIGAGRAASAFAVEETMSRLGLFAVLAASVVLAAPSLQAAGRPAPMGPAPDPALSPIGSPVLVEAPMPQLRVGDPAPAFSFIGDDGGWHGFRQRFSGVPVLLLIGAREEQLRQVGNAAAVFHDLGVRTVAVLDVRPAAAARLAKRLKLSDGVIGDSRCVIGGLYSSLDPNTQHHAPSYFVLDERGTIRGLGYGDLPSVRGLIAITAHSLGRALPESAWSSSVAPLAPAAAVGRR
jgi:peroxiredoxin